MFFIFKIIFSGVIIAFCSWLAGKKPALAGFIIALPIMSMLAIPFTYYQYKDMNKINEFAYSIIVAVPLSLTFFIPFALNRWLKMNFILTYTIAIVVLAGGYLIHAAILKNLR